MIKPKIKPCVGDMAGYFICHIDEKDEPDEDAEVQEHWNYLCVGIADSMEASYEEWVKDCKTWSEYEHN